MRDDFSRDRDTMVEDQIAARGVRDPRVLAAMRKVPRHRFVAEAMTSYAYQDEPLPIGEGQTISQPYIVAYMSEVLELRGAEKILEIGTGSGYQTAILAELAKDVYTIELVESLSLKAQEVITALGYTNVHFKIGDGTIGWKEHSPYDAIVVTAAPGSVPKRLQDQLAVSGRMIIPVGIEFQELVLVVRDGEKFREKRLLPVRFVPLVSVH